MYHLEDDKLIEEVFKLRKELNELEIEHVRLVAAIHNKRVTLSRLLELLEIKGIMMNE